LGTTDEELRETMAIAMSVGVTKIQILQEKAISSLPETTSSEIQMEHGEETQTEQEVSAA
jgi:ABC-type phosphate transport system permease subunit